VTLPRKGVEEPTRRGGQYLAERQPTHESGIIDGVVKQRRTPAKTGEDVRCSMPPILAQVRSSMLLSCIQRIGQDEPTHSPEFESPDDVSRIVSRRALDVGLGRANASALVRHR
jgi:hypothetical protein